MTIVFKNGKEVEITQEAADILSQRIVEGARQWQVFFNEKGKVFLMINLNEVAYVADSETHLTRVANQ